MNAFRFLPVGIIVFSLVFGSIPLSDSAVLWDLLIQANVENATVFVGDTVIVSGQITDHAGNPVPDVQVRVKSGQISVNTVTDENGIFGAELEDSNRIPGIYLVNIMATAEDGKMGMSTTSFQVKGDLSASTALAQKLSTSQAQKYLNSTAKDFEKNSIGLRLYNHYQELFKEFLEAKNQTAVLSEEQEHVEKQRIIADQLRQLAIEEKDPGPGTYSGWSHDRFVENLDPSIKDVIVKQLNHTKDAFIEAQRAMNQVLQNGGSMKEARLAYFEKAAISRSAMESLTLNRTAPQTQPIANDTSSNSTIIQTNSTITQTNSTSTEQDEKLTVNVNGTDIDVASGTTISMKVNGTIHEFLINSTGVYQLSKSE
ncbi:MAG: carboxypeptidase regulatory-like domain-containing protein [Nitrosopumilaceae archaeon]|nr:carboxypeptidase regulatory-like domain-containing protein [Nitrosopumilaceae archaeon]NIU00955.1 carboxypeptidase regulatory-like domain-containing protein [Nitrosopumilaceae archaeon]NIU87413.1 carboxypeptidase regulatory-like domain-containing protein [Nitrosopumilaceae archaeon]NIV65935.1 carboxypeptidase regulatory-like domain-containing protein [Nitrosopumilaceae archaeon]NIX61557.1 carboxypeptidase regulatory-like domain-containing protein [Nitrosopumilaceae archaeon]